MLRYSLLGALLVTAGIGVAACGGEISSELQVGPDADPASGIGADADLSGESDAGEELSTDCETYRLRHLQASMQRTDTPAQRRVSMNAAFDADAHTISWTEIENQHDIDFIAAKDGWTTFWPSGKPELRAMNAVPLSWRSDMFTLVKGQSWKASDGLAKVSPSRFVTRVWLRHIPTGQVQSRVAHHSVSGVDGAGKDPVQWRREAHAKNIAKFREVMNIDDVPVVGSADFNTVRLKSLLGTGFEYDVPASGGSHGSRLIDWIVRRPHPELVPTVSIFRVLGNSDHKGVRAGYDYTPTQCLVP